MNESDIGSGDKTPADHETQKLIEEIGNDRKNAASQKDTRQQQNAGDRQHGGPNENH
jgi:hypothetical protein